MANRKKQFEIGKVSLGDLPQVEANFTVHCLQNTLGFYNHLDFNYKQFKIN